MIISCFERALEIADESNLSDIWYNISHVSISIGDFEMATYALKLAISENHNHAESYNNLGVLELKLKNIDQARSNFETCCRLGEFLFEPRYNLALLGYQTSDKEESFNHVKKALEIFPDHVESKELMKLLIENFTST